MSLADVARRPSDDQVYVVTYFNSVEQEVVGLDAVRNLLINPAARVEGARTEDDFPSGSVVFGGTYAPKR
jgi:hypothetical protein